MVRQRTALEKLWKGVCSIFVNQEHTDPVTKLTSFEPVETIKNQPCKLSYESITVSPENATDSPVAQGVKLFIAPEVVAPPGSKITVTQDGVTNEYSQSGKPAVYSNHQEIKLVLFRGWA